MVDSTCILTQGILYIEINHLRKAEPIQLYQILDKGKMWKNSKHVLFIIFLKFEAIFDKLRAKNRKKSIPYLLNLLSFVPNNSNVFILARLSFLRIAQKWQLPANVFKILPSEKRANPATKSPLLNLVYFNKIHVYHGNIETVQSKKR